MGDGTFTGTTGTDQSDFFTGVNRKRNPVQGWALAGIVGVVDSGKADVGWVVGWLCLEGG